NAWVTSPMYRGFEQILHGKQPQDALVYTPRICGICSVSQSVATAAALANLTGVEVPRNGELATNLIHATENIADHFTHFYLFFMPDFAREVYKGKNWHPEVVNRFKAVKGVVAKDVMRARAELMHIMGLLAGKWPHTLGIQPGGCSRSVEAQEKVRLLSIISAFKAFLEQKLFGDRIENLLAINSEAELKQWAETTDPNQSDFSR
ncbi:MAG: HupV protein, partial [Aestuariibacter sp.]|nr:HupV protein [Aestuariibacter sp.]